MDPSLQQLLSQASGQLGPQVLNQLFNQVEVSTAITPTLTFPLDPNGPPPPYAMRQLLDTLQPTVVLTGPAGRVQLAPFGASQGATSWLPLAVVGLGTALFLGWAVFGD